MDETLGLLQTQAWLGYGFLLIKKNIITQFFPTENFFVLDSGNNKKHFNFI